MALRSSAASLGKSSNPRRGVGSGIWRGDAAEDGDEPGHLGGVEGMSKPRRRPAELLFALKAVRCLSFAVGWNGQSRMGVTD
jgi:hypothetical protein